MWSCKRLTISFCVVLYYSIVFLVRLAERSKVAVSYNLQLGFFWTKKCWWPGELVIIVKMAVVQFLSMLRSSLLSVNQTVSNKVLFLVNKEFKCAGGSSISLNHMWLDHRTRTSAASPRNRYNQHHQFSNTTTVVHNQPSEIKTPWKNVRGCIKAKIVQVSNYMSKDSEVW